MDIKTQLYQMFILGTEGEGYRSALKKGLGGIILFTRDVQTPEQIKTLTDNIKIQALIPPFISIDQEGGRVERTENIHNGKKYLSARFAFEKGEFFLVEQTQAIAQELKNYGINLNFAPCLDVNTNPNNPIIGERAFSSNTDEVSLAGNIVAKTYKNSGIIPCVKHFPGHGDANSDSHLTLPEINLPLSDMEKIHIKPFLEATKNGIEIVMIAHLHCTCFEKASIPTSLSKNAIQYLREKVGFSGVIISDDMIMKGVAKFGMQQACEMGIRAGLNMFIYRYSTPEIIEIIENIAKKALSDKELAQGIEKSYDKILKVKQANSLF